MLTCPIKPHPPTQPQDKDRAYFVGEVRDHAVRLEEAEAALIERERELSEAVRELAWVRFVCSWQFSFLPFVFVCILLLTPLTYNKKKK